MDEIAGHLAPNPGDEAFVVDPNMPEHYHPGQTSGDTHADGYRVYNDDGRPSWEKYHSDDQ